MSYDDLVKVLIIGDSSVGKSSLLGRYADNKFLANIHPTIGMDFKVKMLEHNGRRVKLQIWDSAGQERFQTITQQYYRNTQGIMLVYDVTSDASFNNVSQWVAQIRSQGAEQADTMLLGNKSDKVTEKVIDADQGKALADEYQMPFFETSASLGDNVDTAFTTLAAMVMKRLDAENKPSGHGGIAIQRPREKKQCSSCQGQK
uniref:Uncharacterized protein n=1 Tax=Noctiluca scintillans TaxID=2966 RepID=A0A6T8YB44_NOCSC|eukprot:CAMPEP_0194507278 /NCGR_PEP_ID=MMETSP0253-20130528/36590_1 /TAXON_ID=2966 /ORGANISM="Noctiluca scintillans" /LENGTH=201 /DNA_ID=CAMNT_0039350145 /DNA_START=26 /DNA_END=631 /DNA_ORIENTATION=-